MSYDYTLTPTRAICAMTAFALAHGVIEAEDAPYTVNRLLDVMRMDAPVESESAPLETLPPTLTPLLEALTQDAIARGLMSDTQDERELFFNRLCGAIMPAPYEIRRRFSDLKDTLGPRAATDWFYDLCRACDYIRVDAINRNVRYFADTACGRLEITINLSKPEKDPRDIARLKNAPKVGYPLCMLCVENPGYAGRAGFPGRHNHRMVPLTLGGEKWYLQYSPYQYYPEHCIVLSETHRPMAITRDTFERLFDFVGQFPHYVIGSNADLPIVGGSILNHDHFQGGQYRFPMDDAPERLAFSGPDSRVKVTLRDWPMTCLNFKGKDREAIINEALRVMTTWRGYSDETLHILARTDAPHNTVTPILRAERGLWSLNMVLRNNRTSDEHPLGIFHPHADLHHIKRENIGLIEVMGLFILPGRLKNELSMAQRCLTGEAPLDDTPDEASPIYKHYEWIKGLAAEHGTHLTDDQARAVIDQAVADKCARVLQDAGVFKQDEAGTEGLVRFMRTVGYEPVS